MKCFSFRVGIEFKCIRCGEYSTDEVNKQCAGKRRLTMSEIGFVLQRRPFPAHSTQKLAGIPATEGAW